MTRLALPLAAAVALSAGVGATARVLAAQAPAGDLVGRLVAVEAALADVPFLPEVTIDPNQTWGELDGDFVGWSVILEENSTELRDLHVAAEEGDGPIADAVAAVAHSFRGMTHAYRHLSTYATHDLDRPVGSRDGDDVASGADEARGPAELGLRMLLDTLAPFEGGYEVLAASSDVTAEQRELFNARLVQVVEDQIIDELQVRALLSLSPDWVLVAISRFEPRFTGEAAARVMQVICVDRAAERAARVSVEPVVLPPVDCAGLPFLNQNQIRFVVPGAVEDVGAVNSVGTLSNAQLVQEEFRGDEGAYADSVDALEGAGLVIFNGVTLEVVRADADDYCIKAFAESGGGDWYATPGADPTQTPCR